MTTLQEIPFLPYIVYRTIFHPTEQKIIGFGKLEKGWHYGDGVEFSGKSVKDALRIHRELVLRGFYTTDAFPGTEGEIQIANYHERDYFSFELQPDGCWIIAHEQRGEEVESLEHISFDEAVQYIDALRSKLCNASAFSRIITGTSKEKDSTTWPSSQAQSMERFPLLEPIAC